MGVEKAFFRFIRGELLNGFYIRKLNLLPNKLPSISELKNEFLYWLHVKFDTEDPEFPIRHNDLKGIAQVAGILTIRGATGFLPGWFRLSEDYIVAGKNRSERGLVLQETGEVIYVRTENDEYPTDISVEASPEKRMSLIPETATPVAYVWGELETVVKDNGFIDVDVLHATPPPGYVWNSSTNQWEWSLDPQTNPPIPFVPFYGDKYLFMTENYPLTIELPDRLLQIIFETHQIIKYNGLGLKHLLYVTENLIPDIISNLKIELLEASSVYFYKMTFDKDSSQLFVNDGWGRFAVWQYFVKSKFPYIIFNEEGT